MSAPSPARPLAQQAFIIHDVLPTQVIALLAGPPGVSKTTLAYDLLAGIQAGSSVLGHPTSPTGVVFVSCDRSQVEHESHLAALGHPPDLFPFFDQVRSKTTIDVIVRTCAQLYPTAGVLFIDGFARLVPDGKITDYNTVADFLCHAGGLAITYSRTIIGCLHAPKTKEGSSYSDPRDMVLGSTAWSGFANLVVVIQKEKPDVPDDPGRKVHILTRASSGDYSLRYVKDSSQGGRLIQQDDAGEADLMSLLDLWIAKQPFDRLIPKREIVDAGKKEAALSERSVERWIAAQISIGNLERPERAKYRRVELVGLGI